MLNVHSMNLIHLYSRAAFSLLLLMAAFFFAPAQRILSEQIIPVSGYDVYDEGYPFGVVSVGSGRFAYVQYHTKSSMYPADNFYLQCLNYNDFGGIWYKEVIEYGRERFRMGKVHRVGNSIVISGTLFLAQEKTYQTVFRYFDTDGEPLHNGAVQISHWEQKHKINENELFRNSPNNKKIFWMGREENKFHCSVWDDQGNKQWEQIIKLPHLGKKYGFKDVLITNEGNPIFLLEQAKPHYSLKDTTYPPLIVRYHPKREKFHTDSLWLDSAFSYQTNMQLLNNQELIVAGVYGREDPHGLLNGAKTERKEQLWNGFFFKRLLLVNTDSMRIMADSLTAIPEDWISQYGEEGSNFYNFKLQVQEDRKGNQAILTMEEVYSDKKRIFFYDVGCVAFNPDNAHMKWANRISKRQRGEGGASLLSYYSDLTSNNVHFVYLSERGARGKLMITSFELETGKRRDFNLASNEAATYLFFPKNSGKVANGTAVLIGMGNPGQNDYKLMTIRLE